MKVAKKIVLVFLLLVLIVSLGFLYFRYFSSQPLAFLKQDNTEKGISSDKFLPIFNADDTSYVKDPDVGTVTGSSVRNEAASEFWDIFHIADRRPADITKIYKRYGITGVDGKVVKGVMLGAFESQTLQLECSPEKTAMFKSLNMEFVSAGFDISKEIKTGDTLFMKCTSETCESVGSECILIRFP